MGFPFIQGNPSTPFTNSEVVKFSKMLNGSGMACTFFLSLEAARMEQTLRGFKNLK